MNQSNKTNDTKGMLSGRVSFTMTVSLEELIELGGLEDLNDLADEHYNAIDSDVILTDIEYVPVSVNEDETINIKVVAVQERL
jgi:hypothetical protein